jgi:hypothetical protein
LPFSGFFCFKLAEAVIVALNCTKVLFVAVGAYPIDFISGDETVKVYRIL